MIEYRDECVGCPKEMGCVGSYCPYLNVPHKYCDRCGEEIVRNEYSSIDYDDLCKDCYTELYGEPENEL